MADQQQISQVLAQIETQATPNLRIAQLLAQVETSAPATSYTLTVSDSTSTSETLATAYELAAALSETLSTLDSSSYGSFVMVLAEVLSLLDNPIGSGIVVTEYTEGVADTVTLAALLGTSAGTGKLLIETLKLMERNSIARGFPILADDVVELLEEQTAHVGKVIADYLKASANLIANWRGTQTVDERLGGYDSTSIVRAYLDALTEIATHSEAITSALGFAVKDTVRGSETVVGAWQGIRAVLEAISALDGVSDNKGYGSALDDVITLTENPLAIFALVLLAADALTGSETVAPNKTIPAQLACSLSLTEDLGNIGQLNNLLLDQVAFNMRVTLNGEVFQCWSFTTDEMYPALFTNYEFTSYANVNDRVYATKQDGIYLLEGADDAGTRIETGIKLDFGSMGSHLKKRLFYAYFGLVGEEPALRVITDSGEVDYYVVEGKAKLAHGAIGRDWQLVLTDIDALDFVEIAPVILTR